MKNLMTYYNECVARDNWKWVKISEVKVVDRLSESVLQDEHKNLITESINNDVLKDARYLVNVSEHLTIGVYTKEQLEGLTKLLEGRTELNVPKNANNFISYSELPVILESKIKEDEDEDPISRKPGEEEEEEEIDPVRKEIAEKIKLHEQELQTLKAKLTESEAKVSQKDMDSYIDNAIKMAVAGYIADLKSAKVEGTKINLNRFGELVKANLVNNKERESELKLKDRKEVISKLAMGTLEQHPEYGELSVYISKELF